MRSVTHFLRQPSQKCSKQTFTVRSAIVNSLTFTSSVFSSPQRRTGKLKKTLSLLWKILLPSSGIQELKNSQAQRNKTDQTVHEARFFRGSIVKTKHRGLTSLTFMQLVPSADRVVRHICIRCVKSYIMTETENGKKHAYSKIEPKEIRVLIGLKQCFYNSLYRICKSNYNHILIGCHLEERCIDVVDITFSLCWRQVFRISTIFYVTGRKMRYKKILCEKQEERISSQKTWQLPGFSAYRGALMGKTDQTFLVFSLRFVDFAAQFCFRVKFVNK